MMPQDQKGVDGTTGAASPPDRMANVPQYGHVEAVVCCFCDLPKIPGGQLIAGPRIYICDACIATSDAVIETDTPMSTGRIRIPLTTMATIYPVDEPSGDLRCSFCGKFRHKADGMAA